MIFTKKVFVDLLERIDDIRQFNNRDINESVKKVRELEKVVEKNARKVEEISRLITYHLGYKIREEDYVETDPFTGSKIIRTKLTLIKIKK